MDARQLKQVASIRRQLKTGEAREMRVAADVSGSELAGVAGVSVTALWRYENGSRVPRPTQALALYRAYAALKQRAAS